MRRASAQHVILEILRTAGGEWAGKTRLHKAFYFAHLYYANERPGPLTDWPLARMPQGPGIHDSSTLLQGLAAGGLLSVEVFPDDGPYPEYRYRLTDLGRAAPVEVSAEAVCAIREAVAFCQGKSAAELSQITHERSRAWQLAKEGDLLDVTLDTIPDEEFERREGELRRMSDLLTETLRGT